MQREGSSMGADGKLPVFVFPTSLTFCSDEQSSHKQVLTLYNPYDFVLKFKVLSTSPKKYSVVDSEGTIKARCCVDIVLRHKDISINNEGLRDKFRIQVSELGQKAIIGRKDITSILVPTREKVSVTEEKFESLSSSTFLASGRDVQQSLNSRNFSRAASASGPSWVIILGAVLCIVALMLPLQGENDSRLPSYAFVTINQKLIAAYFLGLVTMAILRS